MKAIGRSLHITSKKLNLIAGLVRTKDAKSALEILRFTPKKGAHILGKIVQSAMANAENNFKQEKETLFIKEIIVTEGSTLKRSVSISRGRVHPRLKRLSHATVILGVRDEADAKETKKTSTPTKSVKTEEEPVKATPAKKVEAPAKKPAAKKKGVTTVKA